MVLRIVRAFGWMRWRVLLNSLGRTGARDTLERLSLAVDQLGPIVAALLLVPSLLAMSALSGFAGYSATNAPEGAIAFQVLRFLALGVSVLAVIGPIVVPVMERPNAVRLMLLPIPRATLYAAQGSSALADPWTLVFLPAVFFLPMGLAVGGALLAGGVAFLAGLIFLLVIVGLSTVTSCAVQLVVRDRRRGELVALAFVLLIPLMAMLSNLLTQSVSHRQRHAPAMTVQRSAGAVLAGRVAQEAFSWLPSERYVGATRAGAEGRASASVGSLGALAVTALLLHGCGMLAFRRLLAFPGSVGRPRSGRGRTAFLRRIPGISPGAGAVALAQLRLVLRTPRGRSTLLSPILILAVLIMVALRRGAAPFSIVPQSGAGLAAFGAAFSLVATLPFAMNQFASDGAGLTLQLLSPLSDDEILNGKAVAMGALTIILGLLCILAALLAFPGGPAGVWVSVLVGLVSMYLLVATAAAVLSTLFPRVVDLNSIGRGSNAHGVATLLGLAAVVLSALPPIGLAVLARAWLKRDDLLPVILLAWCAAALATNRLIHPLVRRLFARRRENLGMVAGRAG